MVARRPLLSLIAVLSLADGCTGDSCTPGTQRGCTHTADGGFTQNGYQACDTTGLWSECVPVGACRTAAGTSLPVYARCTGSASCGPADCAACGHYEGVQNPNGYQVCYAYCQTDTDCAPTTASMGVTPRCVLGQCTLLCQTGATCPGDSRCLSWASASVAATYPGFDGLCE